MTATQPHRGAYPLLVGTTWRSTCAHCWWQPITEPTEVLRLIRAERAS